MASDPWALAEALGIEGIDAVVPFAVPLRFRFRGLDQRRGFLLHGAQGWGEWSPFDDYPPRLDAAWLASAIESALEPPPPARRDRVEVNVTVPVLAPMDAARLVADSGCRTAKVKVAGPGVALDEDVARVAAVRSALGPTGRIRIDANAAWSVNEAVEAVRRLEVAADGLEYAEQPCRDLEDLATVRARTGVRIAVDESIRLDRVPPSLLVDAADVAVMKVGPSGGARRCLELARRLELPVVVSSALDTTIGLASGLRLAVALDEDPPACGLGTGLLLGRDALVSPLLPVDGVLAVADVDRVMDSGPSTARALHAGGGRGLDGASLNLLLRRAKLARSRLSTDAPDLREVPHDSSFSSPQET